MRSIETAVEIGAPPAQVWQVVTAIDSYPEWNPFIRSLEGELHVGARLRVRIEPPNARGITLRPKLVAFTPNTELRWLGRLGLPRVFDGEHRFELEALDGGRRTRFVHAERFNGVLVPLLGSLLANTEAGFAAMNEALRERVETMHPVGPA
jgi:hypothetical protein